MFWFLLWAFAEVQQCVVDRCEGEYCVVETPSGFVDVLRKDKHTEGGQTQCPAIYASRKF